VSRWWSGYSNALPSMSDGDLRSNREQLDALAVLLKNLYGRGK
jgi:hypothetical protein